MEFKPTHRITFCPSGEGRIDALELMSQVLRGEDVMVTDVDDGVQRAYRRGEYGSPCRPRWTWVMGMWLCHGNFTPFDLPGVLIVEEISKTG